ncbi:MAG TPA: hypothetical protein ENN66_02145 [Proteobacteria bacterium]|nr:hypothetical protein [Pseudomonadota bacterium]
MKMRWRGRWGLALLALSLVLYGLPALALEGGPDRFGYRYIDSAAPGGPAYAWENLENDSTTYEGFDKPEFDYKNTVGFPLEIGFPFTFYGKTYRALYLAANGYISFSYQSENYKYDGSGLPSKNQPNNLIAPFWGWHDTYS